MYIYIVGLIITIVLSGIIEKNKIKNPKVSIFFSAILLFILSFIAGARSINLGWDASKYVVSTFNRLELYGGNFSQFLDYTTVEKGFSTFSYALYKIHPNINFLLFGYSFITTLLIMMYAFKEKEHVSFSMLMIVYYMVYYLITFNIIRQSISIMIVLLSYSYFSERKYAKSLVLFALALSFHSSTIFTIPIYTLNYVSRKTPTKRKKRLNYFLIISFTILLSLTYEQIASFMASIGLISNKYIGYITNYDRGVDYNLSNIIFNIYWILLGLLFLKSKLTEEKYTNLSNNIVILVISLIINIVSIKLHPVYRAGFFFYYIGIFSFLPTLNQYISKENITNRKLAKMIVLSAALVIFLWTTILGNAHHIYPYQSDIYTWLS